jgi:hypothetical protein
VSGYLRTLAALHQEEESLVPILIGGGLDPRAGLDDMQKLNIFTLPRLKLRLTYHIHSLNTETGSAGFKNIGAESAHIFYFYCSTAQCWALAVFQFLNNVNNR